MLADKEVILTALNIKSMSFADDDTDDEDGEGVIREEEEEEEGDGAGEEDLKDNEKSSELARKHLIKTMEQQGK